LFVKKTLFPAGAGKGRASTPQHTKKPPPELSCTQRHSTSNAAQKEQP